MSNSAGKSKLEYDNIRDLILSEEVRKRDVNIDNAQDQAFVTENKSRGRSKGPTDRKFNGRSQSRDRSQFKETRECFHCGKNGHLRRDCWHWNKEQYKGKYEKNDSEKNITVVVIVEDVVVLSIEKQKCEHVTNNDDERIVNSTSSHHVMPMKGLFITYKARDFGTVKMGNSSYSKIMGIVDLCTETKLTNVGSTVMLKDMQHVSDLRMNVFSILAMDRVAYCNYLGNGRWQLTKGSVVIARGYAYCSMYKTHVKICKKKLNEIKDFEKIPQLRVGINGVDTRRVKFSLPNSALEEEVIGDEEYEDAKVTLDDDEVKDIGGLEQGEQYPPLKIVEPHEKRTTREHHTVSFKNNWASNEGSQGIGLRKSKMR